MTEYISVSYARCDCIGVLRTPVIRARGSSLENYIFQCDECCSRARALSISFVPLLFAIRRDWAIR